MKLFTASSCQKNRLIFYGKVNEQHRENVWKKKFICKAQFLEKNHQNESRFPPGNKFYSFQMNWCHVYLWKKISKIPMWEHPFLIFFFKVRLKYRYKFLLYFYLRNWISRKKWFWSSCKDLLLFCMINLNWIDVLLNSLNAKVTII